MKRLNIAALVVGTILTLASMVWALILELNGHPVLDQVAIALVFGLITLTLAGRS